MIRRSRFPHRFSLIAAASAVALAAVAGGSACSVSVVSADDDVCFQNGQGFAAGDTFPSSDGCNTCTCMESGAIGCTEADCSATCSYGGKAYQAGDSFPAEDGCNTCSCGGDGSVGCTEKGCIETCEFGGQIYEVGQTWQDDCNSCACDPGGVVGCTAMACEDACDWKGQTYWPGDIFPAGDGCNTCSCAPDGSVSCTEEACPDCDPATEWHRSYVSTDPQECTLIDFACPPNTTYFGNACGCGCEQDPSCPQFFDCMPPNGCDVEAIKAKCPYSTIAY